MKKINLIGLSVASVAILAGCGGGGNPPSATNTGTGYYVDSAVEGVNYTCGSQTGVTDKDGKFTFEEGAGCKFSIAGITLREVSKDKLANGKKVLENDLEVAQFLQSIDSDGDASNGIQITPKVLHILNEALKGEKDVPKGDELVGVVSEVEQQDHSFKGKVKTKEEVIAHLEKSSTQITKELLAGKTFYAYIEESDHTELVKLVINKDATSFSGEVLAGDEKGKKFSEKIEIKGTHLIQYHDDGDIGTFIVTQKANYIELKKTEHNNIYKFFNTEAEAKAELESKGGGEQAPAPSLDNPYSAENLKKYFAGKTFYFVRKNELRSVTVSKDGKVLNFSSGKTYHVNYKDHKLVDEGGEHFVNEITDKYVKVTGGEDNEEITLYLNKADAEAVLKAGGGDDNNGNQSALSEIFVGKVYYIADDDSYTDENGTVVNNAHVEKLDFKSDGHTVTDSWDENGEIKTRTFNYSVNKDTLTISGTGDSGKKFTLTITDVVRKDKYLEFTKSHSRPDTKGSGKFYYTESDAEAALK